MKTRNDARKDGRKADQLRPIKITPNYLAHPSGSCLIEMGNTRVVCSVILEETVPHFLKGSGRGWLTAEYSMLPGSSAQRVNRERAKIGGRTHEIQRLIGRSLRACIDPVCLGERSLLVDCDVLDADGGTRTASITAAYVAVALAVKKLSDKIPALKQVLKLSVAAVSVGIVEGVPCLDLNYGEDKDAEVDMNIVKTSTHRYVEVQGTAESTPYDRESLNSLLALADQGIEQLLAVQQEAIR
jgi:ribonuclease PH